MTYSLENSKTIAVKYKSSNDLIDKPLTFNNKIKSSGYSAVSDRFKFFNKLLFVGTYFELI